MNRVALFQRGDFCLHSGDASGWKIECDALSPEDWATLAFMLVERLEPFGGVEGVPTGGLALAEALTPWVTRGPLLVVDDVLTTGASMEEQRAGREAIGAVVFARGRWPNWVRPLFALGPRHDDLRRVEEVAADRIAQLEAELQAQMRRSRHLELENETLQRLARARRPATSTW